MKANISIKLTSLIIILSCVLANDLWSMNDKEFNERIKGLEKIYHETDNLYLKAQIQVVLFPEEYLSKDGLFVDKANLKRALIRICLPIRKGVLEDWIEENIYEKINETIFKVQEKFITKIDFLKLIIKINVKQIIGNMPWNKVKNLTLKDANEDLKFDL